MITLAILKQLVADGVAGLELDKDAFWEEVPLQKNGKPAEGVWLVTRGGSQGGHRKLNQQCTVDFYVAFANKVKTEKVHQQILSWLVSNKCFCELREDASSTLPYGYSFENVRVFPTSTPQNAGATDNGLIVKMASAMLVYDEKLT